MVHVQPGDLGGLLAQHKEHGVGELGQLGQVVQVAQVEHLRNEMESEGGSRSRVYRCG